jgi:hypothetical protein
MKPTQEQIEAALAYAEERDTLDHCNTLHKCRPERILSVNSLAILAAAYRDAMAENERLQGNLSASNFVAPIPPHEIICARCGLREERGEKPSCDF